MKVINVKDELDEICAGMAGRADDWVLNELQKLRFYVIEKDSKHLRDASAVLKREGKAYQRDLYERIDTCLDGMGIDKPEDMPVPLIRRYDALVVADGYETERKDMYVKLDNIRNKLSDEQIKRALYLMTWELPEDELENLLILFREAMIRYNQMHRNIFDEHRGVKEIRYRLALLGITEVVPESGDEFDPAWHVHSEPQKTGFSFVVDNTVHAGFKRNGRKLLKAIVGVREV